MDDTGDDEPDYASYEYQTIGVNAQLDGGERSAVAAAEVDPLGGIGGLSQNEIAELVWLKTSVTFAANDDDGDQDVGTAVYTTGLVGANCADEDFLPIPLDGDGENDLEEISGDLDLAATWQTAVQEEVFDTFQAAGGLPFDDTDGPGGSASFTSYESTRPFRSEVGRGPVLDANDKITVLAGIEAYDNIIAPAARIQVQLVWDVAETSDAGRRFSVPR